MTAARADCPAAPLANPDDMVVSFLVANGVQAASSTVLSSSVKEGMLVYDDTANALKYCDGTNWVGIVGAGSGGAASGAAGLVGQVQFNNGTGGFAADAGLTWDNTNKRLGIGAATPATKLVVSANAGGAPAPASVTVAHIVGGDATDNRLLLLDAFGAGANLTLRSSGGTLASPAALAVNAQLGAVVFFGYGATAYTSANRANIIAGASENWTDSANGTYLSFGTTPNGAAASAERLRIDNAGNVGIGTTTPASLLHVAGGIQLGDDTATCPGASNIKLGTLRFNTGALQICTASGWGAVTTGGGSGASPAFMVMKSADQASVNGVWNKVTWQSELFDTTNNFVLSTDSGFCDAGNTIKNCFKPTVAGKYQINLSVYSSNSSSYVHPVIYKNGGPYVGNVGANPANIGTNVSAIVDMNGTTDYIEGIAYVYCSASCTISSAYWTHFSGSIIGGGSGGGGGSSTLAGLTDVSTTGIANGKALVYNSTSSKWEPQTISGGGASGSPGPYLRLHYTTGTLARGNIIPFNAVDESGGGASWASNKFTAVTPGVYFVALTGRSDEQYYGTVTIRKNGSDLVNVWGSSTVAAKPGNGTAALTTYLAAGDYIEFYWNHDSSPGTLDDAYASIAYVGDGGGGGSVSGTTNTIAKFTSATAVGNSQIQDNGTSLGVGIAPGAHKVTIAGNGLRLLDTTTNSPQIELDNSSQSWQIFNNSGVSNSLDIYDQTAAQHRLVIDTGGRVGVGTTAPSASALMELSSTSKGFLLPRMTTAQRDAISSPATGLKVYNTDKGTTDVFTTASGFGAAHWELNGGNLRALGRGTSGSYDTILGDGPGGIWWMDGPGSTNGPTGTNSGVLMHFDPLYYAASTKNKYAVQFGTVGNGSGALYFREQLNGAWSSWIPVAGGSTGTSNPNPTVVFSGGGNVQITLANGAPLYQNNTHDAWASYTTLPTFLLGTTGTDTVN